MSEKETLSLKKKNPSSNSLALQLPESASSELDELEKTTEKSKVRLGLYQLLNEVFLPTALKDGQIKPAKVKKATLKEISDIDIQVELSYTDMEDLIDKVKKTDPELQVVTQLAVTSAKSDKSLLRKVLIDFCVRSASACWINHHQESNNLYRDFLEKHNGLDTDALTFLNQQLVRSYDKRIHSSKSADKNGNNVSKNTAPSISPIQLLAQRDNVLVIGAVWLFVDGQIDPRAVIRCLTKQYETIASSAVSEAAVSVFLAEQLSTAKSGLADTLAYFQREFTELISKQKLTQGSLQEKNAELEQLKASIRMKDQELAAMTEENSQRAAEIEQLLAIQKEKEEDGKAVRTHLKDDTGRAKAKAINLLTEDVIEPLRLSLAALKRDTPKTEAAIYQIELVLESVEKELKWFAK